MRKLLPLLIIGLLLSSASAHIGDRARPSGDGFVELTLRPSTVSANNLVSISITVEDSERQPRTDIPLSMSIHKNGEKSFSTSMRTGKTGTATLDYRFKESGNYNLTVNVREDGQIRQASFPVQVDGIEAQRQRIDLLILLIAILSITIGYIAGMANSLGFPRSDQ